MSALTFTNLFSLPRWHSTWANYPSLNCVRVEYFRLEKKWVPAAMSRKKIAENVAAGEKNSEDNVAVENKVTRTRTTRRTSSRTRKKASPDVSDQNAEPVVSSDDVNEESEVSSSSKGSRKTSRRGPRKTASATASEEEESTEKKVRRKRKTKKTNEDVEDQVGDSDAIDNEQSTFFPYVEEETDADLGLDKDGGEDVSYTYGWPPLVCCFGAAQHAFVPSGRPANRLLNYEIHDRIRDAFWEPEDFVRAPGGCAGGVAIALAKLGGKVAFMGKLGDDEYGQAMLYYLNSSNVQTRSVRIESKRATALSQMKIAKRGRLKMTCIKPCAEDSLSKSEINIDLLKEAKFFYFSTHSLLDRNMRAATLQAIKIAKKLGAIVFYDVNLPMLLWQSSQETKEFIQDIWGLADIIEVTKQELEFLCGIEPTEEFNTRDNKITKFPHYEPEVIQPLWHDNLKILFVTNGTSKIHYYTKEFDGAVLGTEDAPLTPFTCDMSASGDGIVAGLMRMLSVQLESLTDKKYLERSIKYAIDCGVRDQWLLARTLGYPPKEDMEEIDPDPYGIRSITEREYRTLESVESVES